MAAVAEAPILSDPAPKKKGGKSKRALKPKVSSSSEANIVAGVLSAASPPPEISTGKENHESFSHKKTQKAMGKGKEASLQKELQEMQEQLAKLKLEKKQTEEVLKSREETLKKKDEEIENRDKEQAKLKIELKKLQKMKEFKPTVTLPVGFSIGDQEQEKDKKKGKKAKKTKKPSPPYVMWCKDQWNEVKEANPEADFKEMATLLGAKWKAITADEKKPYEERYQAEKDAYLKIIGNEKREQTAMQLLEDEQKQKTAMELLEQYLQFKHEAEKETKKPKKAKDPSKPKQPMSAYFILSKERRTALLAENKSILEVAKITGEEWKKMTDKEREPYQKTALENKEQYAKEMEVYKQKKDEEAANLKREEEESVKLQKQEALQLLKKKEKTEALIKKTKEKKKEKGVKKSDPNKPKKPASSFLLFSKEARKNSVEEKGPMSNATVSAMISVKWKEMGEEEKKIWNEKAAEAMKVYKKEMEEYNKKKNLEETEKSSS